MAAHRRPAIDEIPLSTANEVVRRLDRIERLLEALLERRNPTADDDRRFLAAIAAAVRGRAFSARELVNHATGDDEDELRAVLAGATPKRIGKRLHRLAGQDLGGLMLRRVDRDKDGTIWRVQVSDLHRNDGAGAPRSV